jgi:hypothetical protein
MAPWYLRLIQQTWSHSPHDATRTFHSQLSVLRSIISTQSVQSYQASFQLRCTHYPGWACPANLLQTLSHQAARPEFLAFCTSLSRKKEGEFRCKKLCTTHQTPCKQQQQRLLSPGTIIGYLGFVLLTLPGTVFISDFGRGPLNWRAKVMALGAF